MNLPIISWVTRATLECTAFPMKFIQPVALRSFGRSPEELHVEYQIDIFSMTISVEMA
jgi:hypothetical protein